MSKIDYNLNLIKGIAFDIDGVLSPSTVPMTSNGDPLRMVNVKDGYAMQLAVKCGIKIAIISGGRGESLEQRYRGLGIKDVYLGCDKKLPVLKEWMEREGLRPEEVAFVGDDIPDIPPMHAVGLPVAPRDGAREVKDIARFITAANGGYGVARELLEELLILNGHWLDDANAFGW